LNGLALTGIFSAFIAFNQALPVRALVSLTPRAFYPVAVVISIAMTFVPTTLRQFTQIKEAQAVRGHRVRGLRDWLPLMLPLLVGGLERALQLAEAMMARGFAGGESDASADKTRLMTIAGLLALLGGWLLRLVWEQKLLGGALMLLGVALVGGTLWIAGRRIPRSVYRPYGWSVFDGVVIYCAAVAAGVFALSLPGLDKTSVFYYPYPRLAWPDFNPLIGLATVGLLGPVVAFLLAGKRTTSKMQVQ
jgi:energy-coupling factor transport system permease protein